MPANNNLDLEDQDTLDYEDDQDEDHDDDEEGSSGSEDLSGDESTSDDSSDSDDSDRSDEDHDDDENLTDPEREAIRARRRQERQDRKIHRRQREESLRNELAARDAVISEMQQQLASLTGKSTQNEVAQLDNAIKQSVDAYNYFKSALEEGAKVNDGKVVADATEKMYQARQAAEYYSNIKKQFLASQNRPPPTDIRVQQYASEWASKNKWYDPACRDVTSKMARVIDDSLVSEGFNPATPTYWDELTRRCNTLLHKTSVTNNKSVYNKNMGDGKLPPSQNKPKSVVAGSGRDSSTPAGSGQYKISAERRQALEEAGLWNDPKLRAEAVKRYKEYDQQQQKTRS